MRIFLLLISNCQTFLTINLILIFDRYFVLVVSIIFRKKWKIDFNTLLYRYIDFSSVLFVKNRPRSTPPIFINDCILERSRTYPILAELTRSRIIRSIEQQGSINRLFRYLARIFPIRPEVFRLLSLAVYLSTFNQPFFTYKEIILLNYIIFRLLIYV